MLAEAAGLPTWLVEGIESAQAFSRQVAVSSRIPYTYAYDYVRAHYPDFGAPAAMSRAETSAWLSDNLGLSGVEDDESRNYALAVLALAYIQEWNLVVDETGSARLAELLGNVPVLHDDDPAPAVVARATAREAAES